MYIVASNHALQGEHVQVTEALPYELRYATATDLPAIGALLQELNRAEQRDFEVDLSALGQALFGDQRLVDLRALLVTNQGQPIAVVLFYPGYDVLTTSRGFHLSDFVVTEGMRRKGIGGFLFASLAKINLDADGKWMALTVLQQNAAAKAFYSSIGMTHVPVDFFAVGETMLRQAVSIVFKQ